MVDVVTGRVCKATKDDGSPCEAAPLTDGEYCFFHSPEHAEEVAEAGRLGGLRRRREKTVAAAYDLDGLGSLEQIRRLLEIAVMDTLGLENSIARSRALAYLAQVSLKLLEVGDFQERLAALETAVGPRLQAAGRKR
jgi:hypothetical protein